MRTSNDEMVTRRDFTRTMAGHLERLASGDVEKLVLMRSSEMQFVIVTTERYEELELAERRAPRYTNTTP